LYNLHFLINHDIRCFVHRPSFYDRVLLPILRLLAVSLKDFYIKFRPQIFEELFVLLGTYNSIG